MRLWKESNIFIELSLEIFVVGFFFKYENEYFYIIILVI